VAALLLGGDFLFATHCAAACIRFGPVLANEVTIVESELKMACESLSKFQCRGGLE
jgi:hypothetical protein